ncbi:hypothetical protein SERLA73DRAFT_185175 [Serpula lacrymans var. lacrymans S7.3]|uniref:Uncharacterized protein n=2 Tax=Serpula lacrymans var. lacrymans TaxID=341189 RepID=F8Q474_SERL3|nr:uncharacterized protein SERLADRAFT_473479 [Serpula lacrymans var. lacrymans S7.9]EGN96930.1 hypothetical protein SERLA73DRAFT_185175 [Serpula lacrymans var. lacrymans S7.3]EGO22523.1 hypothetical protein SERLADRAFT_473479 [Serpula lacrymans var. lacrymans S7.9]
MSGCSQKEKEHNSRWLFTQTRGRQASKKARIVISAGILDFRFITRQETSENRHRKHRTMLVHNFVHNHEATSVKRWSAGPSAT